MSPVRRSASVLFLLAPLAAFVGTGCADDAEGGDDEDPSATSQSELTKGTTTAPATLDAEELTVVAKVNQERVKRGLAALGVSVGLTRAAQAHSADMAKHDFFSHETYGAPETNATTDFRNRVANPYPWFHYDLGYGDLVETDIGEDCIRNHETGIGTYDVMYKDFVLGNEKGFTGFPDSDFRGPNMINPSYRAIGVARAKGADGTWYFTVTYGHYAGKDAPMLSSTADGTILPNGGFESGGLGKGSWKTVADWYPPVTQETGLCEQGHTGPKCTELCYPWTGCDVNDARINKWHVKATRGASVTRRKDNEKSGLHGLRIADTEAGAASATQILNASPGVNYQVSARARYVTGTGGTQKVYLDFLDKKFVRIGELHAAAPAAYSADPTIVKGTSPAGARYLRVILFAPGASRVRSTYDWDDINVKAW